MFAHSLDKELDNRVLIVDATLRKEGISTRTGHGALPGLVDLLFGGDAETQDLSVDELIQPTAFSNISILPAGTVRISDSTTLTGPRIASLLENLRSKYDYIIIQSGSILDDSRYLLFPPLVDVVILLANEGEDLIDELDACQRKLKAQSSVDVRLLLTQSK